MTEPMQFSDTPPLRYMGSKWKLADWLVGMFPPHVCCGEPYCGAAAVFFRNPSSKVETLNDLNGDLVNFFDMLRTRRDELLDAIELTPEVVKP